MSITNTALLMNKVEKITGLTILLIVLPISSSFAQTCSCAGAPLISSQSAGATSAGHWVLGITYEFHEISTVYNSTTVLEGDETRRSTQSTLVELNYGVTDRLGVSGTFSFVRKHRDSGRSIPGTGNTVVSSGLGDGLITMDYQIIEQSLWNRFGWTVTGGTKIPFGSTTQTNNGFQLNADMQPGTGAWDGVAGTQFSVSLLPWTTMNLFLDSTYRNTGSNERFGENDRYEFGNEWVTHLGAAGEINEDFSYVMQFRYRTTTSDTRNGNIMPNTGGYWFTLQPALNYGITNRFGMRISGQIPVHQNLKGTQPSTTFAVSGSLFINFNQTEQDFIYGTP